MEQENEEFARKMMNRAENLVKVTKALVITIIAIAAGMIIFALLSLFAIEDKKTALVGLIVFTVLIALLLIAVVVLFIYTKNLLNKIRKLN